MFEIYNFGFQCGFFSKEFLQGEVSKGSLSETDYHRIVGDTSENTVQSQPTQA